MCDYLLLLLLTVFVLYDTEGDVLFTEVERYHEAAEVSKLASCLRRTKDNSLFGPFSEALFDPILEEYVVPHDMLMKIKVHDDMVAYHGEDVVREDLLKRTNNNSLFSSNSGAMYDPILHEYILPSTKIEELKALKEDMLKKRQLFIEMKMRRDHNLEFYELYCDPLVNSYRMRDLMFKGSTKSHTDTTSTKDKVMTEATVSKPRKLNQGDDLLRAFMDYE